jgi:hypothetical protein
VHFCPSKRAQNSFSDDIQYIDDFSYCAGKQLDWFGSRLWQVRSGCFFTSERNWRQSSPMGYGFPMEKFRTVINLAIWATAAAIAAFRIGTSDALMVGMSEGLMVLIVAFVAYKTLDLLIMTASKKEDE